MYSDHLFFGKTDPGCGKITRLYTFEIFFNGTKGSLEEEIFYTLLEPSVDF